MIHRSPSSSAHKLLDPVYSTKIIAANAVYRTKRDILHAVVWWLEMAADVLFFKVICLVLTEKLSYHHAII